MDWRNRIGLYGSYFLGMKSRARSKRPFHLNFLRRKGVATERKLRLFAVACCRHLLRQVRVDPHYAHAVDLAERHADGEATSAELIAKGVLLEAMIASDRLRGPGLREYTQPRPPERVRPGSWMPTQGMNSDRIYFLSLPLPFLSSPFFVSVSRTLPVSSSLILVFTPVESSTSTLK